MLEVTSAQYVSGYKVRVVFSDGTAGTVDLESSLWGEVFEPLRDPVEFRKVSVSPVLHTLCWPNDADFAPEHLKRKLAEQRQSQGAR